jgi:methylthioribose-1-phosphate isomerase
VVAGSGLSAFFLAHLSIVVELVVVESAAAEMSDSEVDEVVGTADDAVGCCHC